LRQTGQIGNCLNRHRHFHHAAADHDKACHRHRNIDREVDEHCRRACLCGGGEADQHEADVVDRRIGQQALDVVLPDRAQRTDHDRGSDAKITICCQANT
jgi:hypothetical protein